MLQNTDECVRTVDERRSSRIALWLWAALTTFLAAVLCSQSSVAAPILTSSEIRRILIERVDEQHRGVRIVVGVIEPDGRRVVAHGRLGVGDERAVNGDAIFEIGSITKLFTELLLADMVERGGKSITLAHLANHTSGLPRMPDNWNPHDPDDPYADYDSELLFQFLSNHKLRRDPGSKREYSNAGFAILGELLAHRAGSSYGDLLVDRICMPLGTSDTTLTVSPETEGLLATGHDMALEPTARHHPQALTAGGALHSTVNDLLTFLAANLGYMQPASERSVAALRAWGERVNNGKEVFSMAGRTLGFSSFIAFSRESRRGVVVLSNMNVLVTDIGRHLIDSSEPLSAPPPKRTEVRVDPARFEGYVGRYQLTEQMVLTVTAEDNRLFLQTTAGPTKQIFAKSVTKYFLKHIDAQFTFNTDADGQATSLTLTEAGYATLAKRIE